MNRDILTGLPGGAPAASVTSALAALFSIDEADIRVTADAGVWRVLAHLGAGSTPLNLLTGGDGIKAATDNDGRSVGVMAESTANANTLAFTASGLEVAVSGGAKTAGVRVDMRGLTGWDSRKRTLLAVRVSSVALGNDLDRLHVQIVDSASGTMTRQLALPIKRINASSYELDLYYYDGSGYTFRSTGQLVTSLSGSHWLVMELTPGRAVMRADFAAATSLPDRPEDSTYRSQVLRYPAGHDNGAEKTMDTYSGVVRLQLQTYGAAASSATLADLYILQEGL